MRLRDSTDFFKNVIDSSKLISICMGSNDFLKTSDDFIKDSIGFI